MWWVRRERSRSAEMSRSKERERDSRERGRERVAVTTGLLNGHGLHGGLHGLHEMRELGGSQSGSAPPSPSPSPTAGLPPEQAAGQKHKQGQRSSYQQDVRKALDRKLRPKRFTFQSTLRQIERRRIAEKLSRDAELKGESRVLFLVQMKVPGDLYHPRRVAGKAVCIHYRPRYTTQVRTENSYPLRLVPPSPYSLVYTPCKMCRAPISGRQWVNYK